MATPVTIDGTVLSSQLVLNVFPSFADGNVLGYDVLVLLNDDATIGVTHLLLFPCPRGSVVCPPPDHGVVLRYSCGGHL